MKAMKRCSNCNDIADVLLKEGYVCTSCLEQYPLSPILKRRCIEARCRRRQHALQRCRGHYLALLTEGVEVKLLKQRRCPKCKVPVMAADLSPTKVYWGKRKHPARPCLACAVEIRVTKGGRPIYTAGGKA